MSSIKPIIFGGRVYECGNRGINEAVDATTKGIEQDGLYFSPLVIDPIAAELEVTPDDVQVRLNTALGIVDLVFESREQFVQFAAGQHQDLAKRLVGI